MVSLFGVLVLLCVCGSSIAGEYNGVVRRSPVHTPPAVEPWPPLEDTRPQRPYLQPLVFYTYPTPLPQVRARRSPQQVTLDGAMVHQRGWGNGGYLRLSGEAPLWNSMNGRHQLSGGAYYQRNFNLPGPRQDYGGNIGYTYRF